MVGDPLADTVGLRQQRSLRGAIDPDAIYLDVGPEHVDVDLDALAWTTTPSWIHEPAVLAADLGIL